MVSDARDDKLMIHYFQDNLVGTSLEWYMQLEHNNKRTWVEFVEDFAKHTNTILI